jgi:RES domain-containing protein
MAEQLEFWRVEKKLFVPSARTGEGARIAGGRWNSPGRPVIYCAESLALAMLEILVHAATPEERADARVWFRLQAPARACQGLNVRKLPKGWDNPMIHPETVALGDQWLTAQSTVLLRVPSVVVPGSWNYLMNPAHPQFRRLIRWSAPTPLQLDRRLVD